MINWLATIARRRQVKAGFRQRLRDEAVALLSVYLRRARVCVRSFDSPAVSPVCGNAFVLGGDSVSLRTP